MRPIRVMSDSYYIEPLPQSELLLSRQLLINKHKGYERTQHYPKGAKNAHDIKSFPNTIYRLWKV